MDEVMTVRHLLENWAQFDGNHVAVRGLFMEFQENICLRDMSAFGIPHTGRIWLEVTEKTQYDGFTPVYGEYLEAVAEGIFRFGPAGHCGRYPAEICAISRIEKLVPASGDQLVSSQPN